MSQIYFLIKKNRMLKGRFTFKGHLAMEATWTDSTIFTQSVFHNYERVHTCTLQTHTFHQPAT